MLDDRPFLPSPRKTALDDNLTVDVQFVITCRVSTRPLPMLARRVSIVFLVWFFVMAEQVTAVRDVLCLSHNPKSNRSERRSGRYRTFLSTQRTVVAYHPPCATVYCVRSVGT